MQAENVLNGSKNDKRSAEDEPQNGTNPHPPARMPRRGRNNRYRYQRITVFAVPDLGITLQQPCMPYRHGPLWTLLQQKFRLRLLNIEARSDLVWAPRPSSRPLGNQMREVRGKRHGHRLKPDR